VAPELADCYELIGLTSAKEVTKILMCVWRFIIEYPPVRSAFTEVSPQALHRNFPANCAAVHLQEIKTVLRNNITKVAPLYARFFGTKELLQVQ
jgi:hypothetical protein